MFETVITRPGSGRAHRVVELPDTRNGGTYLKCDCAGWAFAISRGGCAHVKLAREQMRQQEEGIELPASAVATAARPMPVTERPGVRTPIDAMLALKVEAPRGVLSEDGYDEAGKRWPVFMRRDMAFEPKWDGYRLFVEARNGVVKLWSRSQNLSNSAWPEIEAAFRWADGVFDGEVVVLAGDGKHTFNALQNTASLTPQQRHERIRYVVWDVLEANGENLMRRPYAERRKILTDAAEARLGPFCPDAEGRTVLTPSQSDGVGMWNAVIAQGMEGVIAKPLASGYHEGQRSEWLKLKPLKLIHATVVAYTTGLSKDGVTTYPFGALVLAEEVDGRLRYAGKCGTGGTDRDNEMMLDLLRPLVRQTPAVEWASTTLSRMRNGVAPRKVIWVEPTLRVLIEFQERGKDGIPRFPSWKGVVR